ncbi:hypothetical protein GN958_ATG18722 [Phytophthora infestans]|uniref:Uncharacterized protein n=1 Tax=Phytophthora infestans TaxID=4787 RepID=A0A8S9TZ16_PHYIN|nr:hypothetical protein GN958_ATG18722 [Phytophthora infestans]
MLTRPVNLECSELHKTAEAREESANERTGGCWLLDRRINRKSDREVLGAEMGPVVARRYFTFAFLDIFFQAFGLQS